MYRFPQLQTACCCSIIRRHMAATNRVPALPESPSLEAQILGLLTVGETLPAQSRFEILNFGVEAIPSLLCILQDRDLLMSDSRGYGFIPIHAIELLITLQAVEAIEPMLETLAATDWMDIAHDRLISQMPRLGRAVLEPALRRFAETADEDFRDSVCAIIAGLAVRDARIFTILIEQLKRDPLSGAMSLAEYGDPAALPYLYAAFDRFELDDSGPFANQELFDIQDAIETLGGEFTSEQLKKVRQAKRSAYSWPRRAPRDQRTSATQVLRPERNEPCWCGSGKKYKKCHLHEDEAARSLIF
jgi:hypothetical protein